MGKAPATSLPRHLAFGEITIVEPAHAVFGSISVFLTPNGSATILGPTPLVESGELGDNLETNRPQLIPQDAWAGLLDFIAAASADLGRPVATVSVSYTTLAYLYAQRMLTQVDLRDDNIRGLGNNVWEVYLSPRPGYDDGLTLVFSRNWWKTTVGRRDINEVDAR